MLLTFITTLYNSEAFHVKKIIDILFPFLINEVEIVFVDDKSKNKMAIDFIREKVIKHPELNIKVVEMEENTKRFGAFYHGIKLAKGKYLMSLDSDDYIIPEKLNKFMKMISRNDYDFISFPIIMNDNLDNELIDNSIVEPYLLKDQTIKLTSKTNLITIPVFAAFNSMVKTSIAQSIDYDEGIKGPHDDAYLSLEWIIKSTDITFVNIPFFIYNINQMWETNSGAKVVNKNIDTHIYLVNKMTDILKNNLSLKNYYNVASILWTHYKGMKLTSTIKAKIWLHKRLKDLKDLSNKSNNIELLTYINKSYIWKKVRLWII